MSDPVINNQHPGLRGVGRLSRFVMSVLRDFKRNQGLLLCGAVAYYTLLSIVPMSILALIGMSHFIEEEQLFNTLSTYLEMIIPGYAATLTEQVRAFLEHRAVVGVVGFLVMLFFSTIAFTVLENAMSVIFYHRVRVKHRTFLISTLIPYVYIFVLGLGILLVSFITGAIETVEKRQLILFGWKLSLEGISGAALYLLGIIGEVLLLTSLYLVMPVVHITFRRALIGGMAATVLWEITRRVLVWYYSVISMVNLIYGSFATAVVALLSTEAIALILLLGAQVIAELERKPNELTEKERSGFET
ncbi:MAG: YihY/virulence factor BrkB family protein [Nitrospirae bacterium]|nr:YihY/virulence factor BrkB family protein [Nitrospirota bacterium]NTW64809.1 YihY/virulence factor BrkB family protein [Nitrospirota bacterium]